MNAPTEVSSVELAPALQRPRGLATGTRIGRYVILRRLAAGGMAELYLARAEGIARFEKLVALKLVLPHLADDPEFVGMFLDEARLAAHLDHPNVVGVLDIGRTGDDHFFAMEYIHGRDLRSIVRELPPGAKMPIAAAIAIVLAVAEGLHHAHERVGRDGRPLGIVHRDVSPSNVLVTYDGTVKVVDFGIARAESRSKATRAGVLKGKSGYMSPEQCRGDAVDRRSDVFSLGILLWELTVGRRLFVGENDYAVMSRIVFGLVPDPAEATPEYPAQLAALVRWALQRDAELRPASARAFAVELEAFAAAHGLRTSPAALAEFMAGLYGPPPPLPVALDAAAEAARVETDPTAAVQPIAPLRRVRVPTALPSRTVVGVAVALALAVVVAGAWLLARGVGPTPARMVASLAGLDAVRLARATLAIPMAIPIPTIERQEIRVEVPVAAVVEPRVAERPVRARPGKARRSEPAAVAVAPVPASPRPSPVDVAPRATTPRPSAPIPTRPNALFPPSE